MFRETLAQIKTISYFSPVPQRAERAMLSRLLCNVKMCKKVLTRNLLGSLVKQRIGTREVKQAVSKLYKNSRNIRRQYRTINIIMKDKYNDSEEEARKARIDFEKATKDYRKEVPQGTVTDCLFNTIMKRESEKVWTDGKKKNNKKIEMLSKCKEKEIKERIHNKKREDTKSVKYKDRELKEIKETNQHSSSSEPKVYGGGGLSSMRNKRVYCLKNLDS